MKKMSLLAVAAVTGIVVGCSSAPKPNTEQNTQAPVVQKDTLASETERYSYALGLNIGRSLHEIASVGLDLNKVQGGMQTALDTTKKPLMTDQEVEQSLQTLLVRVQEKRQAHEKAKAQQALEEQKAFLASNAKVQGVVTTPSGLQYQIIQNAEGMTPRRSDKVVVHYTGSLLNGTKFDSSYDRGEPLEFPVNAVIEGWQELLTNMKVGMKAKAWIPSELAYGEEGVQSVIPGNALLVFDVELLEVKAEMPPADTLNVSTDSAATVNDSAKVETPNAQPTESAPASKEAVKAEATKTDSAQTVASQANSPKTETKAEAKPAAEKAVDTKAAAPQVTKEPAAKAEVKTETATSAPKTAAPAQTPATAKASTSAKATASTKNAAPAAEKVKK